MRRTAIALVVLVPLAGCSATDSKPDLFSQANIDSRQAPIAARASGDSLDAPSSAPTAQPAAPHSSTREDYIPPPPDSASWVVPDGAVGILPRTIGSERLPAPPRDPVPAYKAVVHSSDPTPPPAGGCPGNTLAALTRSNPAPAKAAPAQLTGAIAAEIPVAQCAAGSCVPAREEADPAGPVVRLVNSKHIRLDYAVKDVGRSGIADVELWCTRDGHTWKKYPGPAQHTPPYAVDVSDEDLYGFTLVGRSGAGLGQKPPQPGDRPQVWVEVDVTPPVVRLLGVDAGTGPRAGTLSILWSASDKNLAAEPITLSYAARAEGPWLPIACRVANSGRYLWRMPPDMPERFLVRVQAVDRAGNSAAAQTPTPIPADLAQPRVEIVTVSAGGN